MLTNSHKKPLIVLTGTTASGKTSLAVHLADKLNGEVISADSRQVYRGMDLGTGKDLEEYSIAGRSIPYHLIDIMAAGDHYDGFSFQKDFFDCYDNISNRNKVPILCGGTGMYINLALSREPLLDVKVNKELRNKLELLSQEERVEKLVSIEGSIHNTTDTFDKERTIRAIEIAEFKKDYTGILPTNPVSDFIIFATNFSREDIRKRIRERLDERLENGLLAEVVKLKKSGVSSDALNYYGLEYKYINQYLERELTYDQMYTGLLQAIRRFAKKQMTWFRRMEKRGYEIHWLNMSKPREELVEQMASMYEAV